MDAQTVDEVQCKSLKLKKPFFKNVRWRIRKAQFCDLVDEYYQLSDDDKRHAPDVDAQIRSLLAKAEDVPVELEDVQTLSALVTLLLPSHIRRLRMEEMIGDLRAAKYPAAGEDWYKKVQDEKDWGALTEQQQRDVLAELHIKKRNLLAIERAGECLKTRIAWSSFAFMIFMFIPILWFYYLHKSDPSWMIYTIGAGALGGLISVLHRTYTSPSLELGKSAVDEIPSTLAVVLSPFFGAVGALIIVMALRSGLSELINFSSMTPGADFINLKNEANLYKLILFSLAAGFSERIIPDTLGRLQTSLVEQGKPA